MSPAANLQAAVDREIAAAGGDLGLAIHILSNDACGARWDAPVHAILKAALKLQSERRASGKARAA